MGSSLKSVVGGVMGLILGSCLAAAADDRKAPTKPGNFRVVAKTAFSISLAWNPATDDSGHFSYQVWSSAGGSAVTLTKSAATYTFNVGLYPDTNYWFGLQARDEAGNYSPPLSLNATTLRDVTAPTTAPVLSVTEVGSTHISLAWSPAQDDGPYLYYQIWINGMPHSWDPGANRSIALRQLQPSTPYTFHVRASDYAIHWSPLSAPLVVTTTNPVRHDTTPPSSPLNLQEEHADENSPELRLWWDAAIDNLDNSASLRYEVYVNEMLQAVVFGTETRAVVYGEVGENTVKVVATDTAGNSSAPALLTFYF